MYCNGLRLPFPIYHPLKIELEKISDKPVDSEISIDAVIKKLAFNSKKKSVGIKVRQQFYADLYLLLNSGLDLRYSLKLIWQDEKKESTQEKLKTISQSVVQGKSLSGALKNTLNIDDFEYFSLKIGEETGRISEILKQLSDYFDSRIQQRRQIISALSYPVIVLVTAIGAVVFMLQVVVPLFQDVFQRFGKDLPELTLLVISASDSLSALAPYMLLFVAMVIVLFPFIRKTRYYSMVYARILRRIPIFGKIVTKMYLLQFVSSLELMLSSNTNLVRAIDLCHQMTTFYPLKEAISQVKADLVNGISLSKSFSQFNLFDSRFLTLIKVGEEVNQLPDTLSKLRVQYEKDIDLFSKTVGSILEPAIILFIGFFVGTIIVAMYLPMFELSTLF